MISLIDTIDPDSLLHDGVLCSDHHAAGQKTILINHLHTCHIHELVWRTGLYVVRLPQRIDGNVQTEVEIREKRK